LGHGLSLTDPHWHPHAFDPAYFQEDYPVTQAAKDGSLHALFEWQAKLKMDALSLKQASLLRGKGYRRSFLKASHPDLNNFWVQSPRVERNAHRYNDYPFK
jgi:hypothetical protein